MLKLIIADDERIIRETISNLIDWNSIGVELIGLCRDGIEAYNMILDESPDIVLTDIKMPGMSGLELVQRISKTDLDTQFILLSGYGEFDYAREGMRHGIRHYLLKPCNEEQIISSMREVIDEHYHRRALRTFQKQQAQFQNLQNSILVSIINDFMSSAQPGAKCFQPYEHLMDFENTSYELCYLFFLEKKDLQECLNRVYIWHQSQAPGIALHGIYVENTLILFFQSYKSSYEAMDAFIPSLRFENQQVDTEYVRVSFQNLSQLLLEVLQKVRRYETIYCMNGLYMVPTCNFHSLSHQMDVLTGAILHQADSAREQEELLEILSGIHDLEFLKQTASSLIIKCSSNPALCPPAAATEFLVTLNQQTDISLARRMITDKLEEIFSNLCQRHGEADDFIRKIQAYVENNLSNPNLTLKWIAEHYLFMNVDYVSKKFIKETGNKFSKYITDLRIQKAKELFAGDPSLPVQIIAEQVGCGNNPQYFSQIFKKSTGLTPSAYAKTLGKNR